MINSCEAEFSASLLQSSVSHDPSEILIICWFTMSNETVVLLNIFWDLWKKKKKKINKEQCLFKIEISC